MTETLKREYEGLFIFPPEGSGDRKDEEKYLNDLVQRFGGTTISRTELGRRPLAYPVKKFREGHFALCHFQMETSHLEEFRKALQLDRKVLKSMITKWEPVSAKPVSTEPTRPPRVFNKEPRGREEKTYGRKPE